MTFLQPVPRRWRGVALILPFVLVVVGLVLYVNRVQQQSERQWCELLTTLDETYQAGPPPETDRGRRIVVAIHQLRQDFAC